jgi:hypothetical protein
MNDAVYDKLVEVARSRSLIGYKELSGLVGLEMGRKSDLDEFVRILDEIAEHEIAAGRPVIVVVVIRDDTKMPGRGFFKFSKARGIQGDADDMAFFATELNKVYAEWSVAKPK